MVARSYILDTKSAQRNSPLVVSAILTSSIKKFLTSQERDDLAKMISTVTFFQDVVTIVTSRPIINFELRNYEWSMKEILGKTLSQHGFDGKIHLHFR